jgi:hypothetical protein
MYGGEIETPSVVRPFRDNFRVCAKLVGGPGEAQGNQFSEAPLGYLYIFMLKALLVRHNCIDGERRIPTCEHIMLRAGALCSACAL